MECVQSSPVKGWQSPITWDRSPVEGNQIISHSAPISCGSFPSSCRRAASFPMAHATALPSALKVRSQSESAGLNKIQFFTEFGCNGKVYYARQTLDGDESLTSSDSGNTSDDDSFNTSKSTMVPARKKSVRFADDCGFNLESIKVMTEGSDIPPKISPSVIRRYRRASKAFENGRSATGTLSNDDDTDNDTDDDMFYNKKHASWKIDFIQPASQYVKFRETFEKQKVALENVMLRNDYCKMVGTIRVANVCFEKRVFVRFSSDSWKSYHDRPATYQTSGSKTYDIFGFEIDIPMDEGDVKKIEFCICYVADTTEFWDSNGDTNYILLSQNVPKLPVHHPPPPPHHHRRNVDADDAYKMDYDNWAGFASWRNLSTDTPYW